MRAEESWEVSRYVRSVLAVEEQNELAWHHRVAMQSIATFPTGLLVSALSPPRPVIALDATSEKKKKKKVFLSLIS